MGGSRVDLDHAARKEVEFWKNNVSHLNSRCFADAIRRPSRIVYSDASAVGCAAFIAIDDMPVSHKNWDSLQMKQSSTWRELHCVSFALKSFASRQFLFLFHKVQTLERKNKEQSSLSHPLQKLLHALNV